MPHCQICESPTDCKKCAVGYEINPAGGNCVASCNSSGFLQNDKCVQKCDHFFQMNEQTKTCEKTDECKIFKQFSLDSCGTGTQKINIYPINIISRNMFLYKKSNNGTLNILRRSNFQVLKIFSLDLEESCYFRQEQSKNLLVVFDYKTIYELDIKLGTILKNTSFNDYYLSWNSAINFPNKLIIAFSKDGDLLLIDYYNSKMELNFTDFLLKNGIIF